MSFTRRSFLEAGASLGVMGALGIGMPTANAAVSTSATGAGSLRYLADFESGTLGALKVSGNAPVPTKDFARSGNWAMKSFLDQKNSANSFRTEVVPEHTQDLGKEYWMGISIRVSDDWRPCNTREILFQIHDTPLDWSRGTNPIIALETLEAARGGQWRFINRYLPVYNGLKTDQRMAIQKDLGPVVPGEWVDWVFNVRWDWRETGGVGFTRVWQRGKLVVDYVGPNAFNDDVGPYVKFGIYKWDWRDRSYSDTVSTRVIYHDEYREAGADGSYALVAPSSEQRPQSPSLTVS